MLGQGEGGSVSPYMVQIEAVVPLGPTDERSDVLERADPGEKGARQEEGDGDDGRRRRTGAKEDRRSAASRGRPG